MSELPAPSRRVSRRCSNLLRIYEGLLPGVDVAGPSCKPGVT
jgi:hypothetical protein